MNAVTMEEERKIFHFLKSQGCCLRCCFRFAGYRTSDCYCKPFEFAAQVRLLLIKKMSNVNKTPILIRQFV